MACGCKSNNGGSSSGGYPGNPSNTDNYYEQAEDIVTGDRQLSLLDALQMVAAIATIVGLVKYLFRS